MALTSLILRCRVVAEQPELFVFPGDELIEEPQVGSAAQYESCGCEVLSSLGAQGCAQFWVSCSVLG